MISSFPRQTIQYHSNPSLCPNHKCQEAEVEQFSDDLQDLLELTPKKDVIFSTVCFFNQQNVGNCLQDLLELTSPKDVLFIIGHWNAKVGSQEIPRVTGKFGLGVLNEAGQRPTEFCRENALVVANTLFQQHKR